MQIRIHQLRMLCLCCQLQLHQLRILEQRADCLFLLQKQSCCRPCLVSGMSEWPWESGRSLLQEMRNWLLRGWASLLGKCHQWLGRLRNGSSYNPLDLRQHHLYSGVKRVYACRQPCFFRHNCLSNCCFEGLRPKIHPKDQWHVKQNKGNLSQKSRGYYLL